MKRRDVVLELLASEARDGEAEERRRVLGPVPLDGDGVRWRVQIHSGGGEAELSTRRGRLETAKKLLIHHMETCSCTRCVGLMAVLRLLQRPGLDVSITNSRIKICGTTVVFQGGEYRSEKSAHELGTLSVVGCEIVDVPEVVGAYVKQLEAE